MSASGREGPGSRLLVVAGEVSGDHLAARLVRAMQKEGLELSVRGVGGDQLSAAGASLLAHIRDTAVVGVSEAVHLLPKLYRLYRRLRSLLVKEPPALLLLIDYPDMNLRLARFAHRLDIPVCYYGLPQVWAWRGDRLQNLRRDVDLNLSLFPFEADFLHSQGVDVCFVGHPLVDEIVLPSEGKEKRLLRETLGLVPHRPTVALLPGSRPREVGYHLETFLEAADLMAAHRPELQFVLALSAPTTLELVRPRLRQTRLSEIRVVRDQTRAVLASADLAVVKSGTGTLEAVLAGTPVVIGYRMARLSYRIARRLVRVPHIGMPNLLLGSREFPELVQDELTPGALRQYCFKLLDSPPDPRVFERVREMLGPPGAARRAARKVVGRFFPQGVARR